MEQISGLSNWKLTVKKEYDHVEILRAVTCDRRAVLPDELWGLPVTVLGDHALAAGASPIRATAESGGAICDVQILCGREDGDWDNRDLEDLTLPQFLTDVKEYALYGCRSLKTLRLHDRVDRWGGGCLMNCRSLDTFYLTRVSEHHGEALAFFCDEIHEELTVTIYPVSETGSDGADASGGAAVNAACEVRLIFPDYLEEFEENCAAHHFDYTIYGGGHPYHHVFKQKQLILRDYDTLWEKFLKEDHDADGALRLAWTRLRWPVELSDKASEQYWKYLKERPEDALLYQMSLRDVAGLRLLLDGLKPDGSLLHKACDAARRDRNTEALALLLERTTVGRAEPTGFDKDFDF